MQPAHVWSWHASDSPSSCLSHPAGSAQSKRKEPDPAEQLLAGYPEQWDGAIATLAALIRAIDGLGAPPAAAAAGGAGGGAGGGSAVGHSPAGSRPPTAALAGGDRAASPMPSRTSSSAVSLGLGGAGAGAAAGGAAAAAAAAAAAGHRQTAAVLATRLAVAVEAACVPDSQRRMVEKACRGCLLELAAAVPAAVAEARQAAAAATGHHRHSGGKHGAGSGSSSAAADVAAAIRSAVRDAVCRAGAGVEEALQRQRGDVLAVLAARSAEAERLLSAAAGASGAGGVDEAATGGGNGPALLASGEAAVEEGAWRWHAAERSKRWLALV
jgi:hypothetical protein